MEIKLKLYISTVMDKVKNEYRGEQKVIAQKKSATEDFTSKVTALS